jgi:hypothetical protein
LPFGLALKELKKGKVYGIDPWTNIDAIAGYQSPHKEFWGSIDLKRMYDICLTGIDTLKINDYVAILKTTSDDAEEIKNISVLHIDGQHTDQLIRDINKYAINVIKGGYCLIDDVDWSEDTRKSVPLMRSLGFQEIWHTKGFADENVGCILYQKL